MTDICKDCPAKERLIAIEAKQHRMLESLSTLVISATEQAKATQNIFDMLNGLKRLDKAILADCPTIARLLDDSALRREQEARERMMKEQLARGVVIGVGR